MLDLLRHAEPYQSRMVELRRQFHRWPELAFQEADTARTIIAELDRLAIPHEYQGVGSAVIGRIAGTRPGTPTVALRADMDALPADENTGLPFASERPGIMHACGHDAHMAMVLGAAAMLRRRPPAGDVVLVFQPAEESGGGARVVLKSGALDGVGAIFGGHVTGHYATGEIMASPGIQTAQSDLFTIRVRGRGGHGARPHEATDAVVIAAFLVTALQTLVSRESNPLHPSVVTIGRLQAGSAANVIAEDALVEGTIRTTLPEVREQVLGGLQRMVNGMAELHDAIVELEVEEGYPPLVNPPREAAIAHDAAVEAVGSERVMQSQFPSMGSEDFAYYLQRMPGAYVRFGARRADWEPLALHSPVFTVDEDVLKVGAVFFDRLVRKAQAHYTH